MKELSITQKARRYDEAIERAKRMFSDKEIDYLFPELQDGENERTRKSIIEFFKNYAEHGTWKRIPDVTKWIAWLEEQGQKSVDKVEAKFKAGDWITDNNSTFQIVKVENEWYHADDGDKICFDVAHQYYHLWTIKDAKGGDILITHNHNIFIFKEIKGTIVYDYCGLYFDKFLETPLTVNGKFDTELPKDYVPATKEQRDQLEKAMADAGYTFDFEKKDLKKVEQNAIEPDDLIEETYQQQADDLIDMVTENSAWSEEDEKMYNRIYDLIHAAAYANYDVDEDGKELGGYAKMTNWFKSIKDRVQPKQEWSEEDEHTMNKLLSLLLTNHPEMWAMFGSWLKCLKERYTWRPSDEQMELIKDIVFKDRQKITRKELAIFHSIYNDLKKLKG